MTQTWRLSLVAVAALAWHASPVMAQGNTQGDADAGRVKASTCIGCHGIDDYKNVYPTFRVPIESALKAYRSGDRTHPTMQGQASSLSDQDIADISAFLANAPKE